MPHSKQKGKRGEYEIRDLFRNRGYTARRGQQYKGTPESPDVTVEGLPIHIEVKRRERLQPYAFMEQAIKDAEDLMPVVFMRSSRKPWLVMLREKDFFSLLGEKY